MTEQTISPETLRELADKFEEAGSGWGRTEITDDDLHKLGLRPQKTFQSQRYGKVRIKDWPNLCAFVYEKVSGEPHPGSRTTGVGFRSRAFGRAVAEMLREKADRIEQVW